MNDEPTTSERLLGLQQGVTDARKRVAELRADAYGLAVRFGYEGEGAAGVELVTALKEILQASEVVYRRLLAILREMQELRGGGGLVAPEAGRFRQEREDWLASVTRQLRDTAARVHHDAEIARRADDAYAARRQFAIKNRFEAVAAAVAGLATPPASSSSS